MNLYKESEQWRPDLELQGGAMITDEEQSWLQRPFEEEEIMGSTNLCAMEKHLDPMAFQ